MIGVCMRVNALEIGSESHLDHGELGQLGLDAVGGIRVLDRLTGARGPNDRVFERSASVFGRLELIEMFVAAAAEDVAEAHARRVNVQEDRGCVARVAEGMHDVRRRAGERLRSGGDSLDIGAEAEIDLSFQDVERIGVLPVNVRIRAFLAGLVAKPRHDQLLELAEDSQCSLGTVGGRLAFTGG